MYNYCYLFNLGGLVTIPLIVVYSSPIVVSTHTLLLFIMYSCFCVIGDNSSVVAVHLLEGGMIIAHINTLNETYYIEVSEVY